MKRSVFLTVGTESQAYGGTGPHNPVVEKPLQSFDYGGPQVQYSSYIHIGAPPCCFSSVLSIFQLSQAFFVYTERFLCSAMQHFSAMLALLLSSAKHISSNRAEQSSAQTKIAWQRRKVLSTEGKKTDRQSSKCVHARGVILVRHRT